MKIINNIIIYIILVPVFTTMCSREVRTGERDLKASNEENISSLLDIINTINNNSPSSFTADFDVEGHSASQKFKATGKIQFNNDPKKTKVVFHDAVFKSPITEIVQEGDALKFYFPFDKTLYIDNANTIKLKSYSVIDLDFNLVADLSTGKIPVIKNYSIVKGLESNSRKEKNKLIILENAEYYETISFLKGIPDKILFLNKNTQEKIEVYFKEPAFKENSQFYKTVRIISLSSDLNITVKFSALKFNIPIDLENIARIKLPKDVKVINISKE